MVVVLNDSSKNNAGVVGPGSSAAGSSIKSATSATTAAASPEKDPARNLTQTFEALCLDADHQHGPAAEALLPGSCGAPPAPVVISPTSVLTPLHHDSRGNLLVPAACSTSNDSQSLETNLGGSISTAAGTKSPSTATPKKAKAGVVGVTMHPDLRRELTQSQVNRVSFYAVLHDINKEAASMAASDVLSLGPDPVDEERSPLVVAAAATLVGGGASVPSKSGDTHHQQHDASTASVGGASSTRKDNVHLGAEMATALIDEEEWLLSTIAARNDTPRPCPPTFLQAMGEKDYENPVLYLAGGSRTQLWKPSRSWWEAKSGKNPWIEPTSHNKRWRYLWPLIHYHKFLAKCVKKLKRNGVDVKQSISPVAVFLREEVCAISDHLAALSLFDSDEWMNALSHFRGWTDPDDEDVLREAVSKLKLRTLNDVADVDSPLLRSQIDEHFLQSMASARAQLREASSITAVGKKPGQPPVYPRSPVPKQIVEKRRWTGAHPASGYPPQSHSAPSVPTQAHHPGWWQHPWETSQHPHHAHPRQPHQRPAPHPYCDNSSVHSALSVDTGLASYHQPHPIYQPHHPYYYPPGSDNSWAHSNMMYMHPPQAYYQMPSRGDQHGTYAHSPEEEKRESPTKADITSSPFWAHLDQAMLATIATPAKAPPQFSTPRKEKNNAGVNAQPLLLQQHQYYGQQYLYESYGPPSPATQFMMSPQANYYSYYGSSPSKGSADVSPRKPSASPCTVGTAESESQS